MGILQGHRLGRPSRMRSEQLWEWLREHQSAEAVEEAEELTEPEGRERVYYERREEGDERDQTKWVMVVELVQTSFRDGVLVEEATWQAVILTPKGGG